MQLSGKDAFGRSSGVAMVQAPRVLPRVIKLPAKLAGCDHGFVFLSSIIHAHVGELFAGMEVQGWYQFRVTRNSDLFVDEEEVKNLRTALQGELPQRHFGDAVRLEVADQCPPEMAEFLLQQFGLGQDDLYQVNGPVNLVRLMGVPDQVARPELKYLPFSPGVPGVLVKRADMFEAIRKGDVLLHHPFQSFRPVIAFIEQAARDPDVVAIKQTVYRTGADSELMHILIDAARRGKEITVVVELMARFDEEANINWAAQLEEVGAHVVYGVVGHKTHAKLAMVVRREEDRLRRYCHIGTGNYHLRTSGLYTDFGLFTANEEVCADVNDVFMQLTGLGKASRLRHLWQSPFTMHAQLVAAIKKEAEAAKAGKKAGLVAKMNALLEPEIIAELYEASKAGVKIELIVRGVCCLRPGIAGSVGEHQRALDHRPLPRASPRVPLRQLRQRVHLQRRLDGSQLLPPHRGLPADPRAQAAEARDRGGPAEVPRGQHPGLGHGQRRSLRALQTRQGSRRAPRSSSCCRSWPARSRRRAWTSRSRDCGRNARRRRVPSLDSSPNTAPDAERSRRAGRHGQHHATRSR